jgi:serine/threonine-protein kinase
MAELSPGTIVRRYRIDSTIATGLYEAFDTRAHRTVVLKVLPVELDRARRFARDARALLTVRDVGTAVVDGSRFAYVAMEQVTGKTLRQHLHGAERMSLDDAIGLLIGVAEAITKVHGAGLVVGGLDADKIVINERGDAKMLDFTLSGDPRDDIHAFGDILHEVVTGRRPFRQFVPAAPRDLAPTINRCLARDTTMAAVVRELEHARALGGGRTHVRAPAWRANLIQAAILIAAFAALVIVARREAGPAVDGGPPPATDTLNTSAPGGRKVIAVLPFDNLGPADDAWLAEGITDEIIDRLGTAHRLGVISRTSAGQYVKRVKTFHQIGKELGADYVLDGTVRWQHSADSRVRLTLRLLRVADDKRVWSAPYDRPINDLFKLQSEIADQVLRELRVSMAGDEATAARAAPTANLEAYEAYLHGQDLANRAYSEADARNAVKWLERAVELDPHFAAALARLSIAHGYLAHLGYDRSPQRLELARAAVDRAVAIEPDLPLAHMALGYFLYWGGGDDDRASAELALAWKAMPNNAEVLEAIGNLRRRRGDFEQALEDLTGAERLDPQNRRLLLDIGQGYLSLRRYDEAAATYERVISLAPRDPHGYAGRAETEWMKGSTQAVKLLLARMKPNDDETTVGLRFRQALYTRDYETAMRILKATKVQAFVLLHVQQAFAPKELLIGQLEALRGNADAAKKSYEAAMQVITAELARAPDDARLHSALGLAYAGLGDATNAVTEGQRGVELQPIARDALSGPERALDLARIYAAVGEKELAIAQLQRLLTMPSLCAPGLLRLDPAWDSLRDEDDFHQLAG